MNLKLKSSNSSVSSSSISNTKEPIAIVGIGCKFPGGVNSYEEFIKVLKNGKDCLTKIPEDRWNADTIARKSFRLNNRIGGFINDIDQFDNTFFGISPKEAQQMDPQQRLLLHITIEALQDANISLDQLKGTNTGVFIGSSSSDYSRNLDACEINQFTTPGSNTSFLSNRISYFLDVNGPSMTINTACSSSLVAIHLGATSIWSGECKYALVGGSNIISSPLQSYDYGKAGLLSTDPQGRCFAFEPRASGYVRAEGCGILVLKKLSQAIKDKDDIYSVILNTGNNSNGKTPSGITSPRSASQESLIKQLLKEVNIDTNKIGYFECHGTGTQMGDLNELMAVGKSIGMSKSEPLVIGSVKANVGHLEGASGICGVIKTIACIREQFYAPQCLFEKYNPKIPFGELNLKVQTELSPWEDEERIAGINSFGVGGSNSNVFLASFKSFNNSANSSANSSPSTLSVSSARSTPPSSPSSPQLSQMFTVPINNDLFTVSVNTNEAQDLRQRVLDILEMLNKDDGSLSFKDLCYTANVRTTHFNNRVAFMTNSLDDLKSKLQLFANDPSSFNPCIISSKKCVSSGKKKLLYVMSGQGQQWIKMGHDLFKVSTVFKNEFTKVSSLFQGISGWSIVEKLFDTNNTETIDDTWLAQPSIFAVQVALSALLKSLNVEPSAIIGHSLGELSAVYLAGILSLEDCIKLLWVRSHLQNKTTGSGKMAVVLASRESTNALIAKHKFVNRICVCGNNSPKGVGIAGDSNAIAQFSDCLAKEGVTCKPIKINAGFHSHLMDPIKEEFYKIFPNIQSKASTIPFYSTTLGKYIDAEDCKTIIGNADYWWNNIRDSVLFKEGMDEIFKNDEFDAILEISAHPIVSYFINQCMKDHAKKPSYPVYPTLNRDANGMDSILGTMMKLYCIGHTFKYEAMYPSKLYTAVKLPNRRWKLESFWSETQQRLVDRLSPPKFVSLEKRIFSVTPSFEIRLSQERFQYLKDHKIQGISIIPFSFMLEAVYAAIAELPVPQSFQVTGFEVKSAITIDSKMSNIIGINFNSDCTTFEIGSMESAIPVQKWIIHAKGSVAYNNHYVRSKDSFSPIHLLNSNNSTLKKYESKQFYSEIEKLHYNYGPAFRALEKIHIIDTTSQVSCFKLPACTDLSGHLSSDFRSIHPSLLDGVFQAAFMPGSEQDKGLWIPQQFESLSINIPSSTSAVTMDINKPMYCYSKINNYNNSNTFTTSIKMFDYNGTLFAEINNLHMRLLSKSNIPPTPTIPSIFKSETINQQIEKTDTTESISQAGVKNLFKYQWINVRSEPISSERFFPNSTTVIFSSYNSKTDPMTQHIIKESIKLGHTDKNMYIVTSDNGSFSDFVPGQGNYFGIKYTQSLSDFDHIMQVIKRNSNGEVRFIILSEFYLCQEPLPCSQSAKFDQANINYLHLTKQIINHQLVGKLYLITKEAQFLGSEHDTKVNLVDYSLVGLTRVFTNEYTDIVCSMIDITSSTTPSTLTNEMHSIQTAYNTKWEVALRAQGRYTYEFVHHDISNSAQVSKSRKDRKYQVEIGNNGVISDLQLIEVKRQSPKANQVEVNVLVSSINFRDILKALGRDYDSIHIPTIGDEFAGIVTEVGSNVSHLKVGDKVFGINMSRAMTTFVTCDSDLVFPIPEGMNYQDACTLPIVFLTSWYSLVVQGRLKKNEKVLIHSAAGGVGLASVQIAKFIGADIYVTVGSQDKHEYLVKEFNLDPNHIFNSRSISFYNDIMHATQGLGVDVVLNSLSGEYIEKSILALAPYGRFVEIGKKDIYGDSKIGLLPFKNNLSYLAVDIAQMTENRRSYLQEMMNEILPLFASSSAQLKPLKTTVFQCNEIVKSLRFMSAGSHIGKILVDWNNIDSNIIKTVDLDVQLDRNATYMITGFGGLAQTVLKEFSTTYNMKNVVVVSKNGINSEDKKQVLESLKENGINVSVQQCDLSNYEQVGQLFTTIKTTLPPLKGIIHTSCQLSDKRLIESDKSLFKTTFESKAKAAWNLHNESIAQKCSLDIFMTIGSVTSVFGNLGQSSYTMSNRFVEGLAHLRHAMGLAASCIHMAPIPEVGMSTQGHSVLFLLKNMGFTPYPSLKQMCSDLFKVFNRQEVVVLGECDIITWINSVPHFVGKSNFLNEKQWSVVVNGAEMSGDMSIDYELEEEEQDDSDSYESDNETTNTSSTNNNGGVLASNMDTAQVKTILKEIISDIMEMKKDNIDDTTSLSDYGLDSLLSSEMANAIHKRLDVFVPSLTLLDRKTNLDNLVKTVQKPITPPISSPPLRPVSQKKVKKVRPSPSSVVTKKSSPPTTTTTIVPTIAISSPISHKNSMVSPAIKSFEPLPSVVVSPAFSYAYSDASTISAPPTPNNSDFIPKTPVSIICAPTTIVTQPPIPKISFNVEEKISSPSSVNTTLPNSEFTSPPSQSTPRSNIDHMANVDNSSDPLKTVFYEIAPIAPPFCRTQNDILQENIKYTGIPEFYSTVFKNCKIKNRYFWKDPKDMDLITLARLSIEEKHQMFRNLVGDSVVKAGRTVIEKSGIDPSLISHIVGVTSTGIIAPSIDVMLIEQLGLPSKCGRTMINFMGCGAAVIAARTAMVYAKARPGTYVLVVAVEASSLNMKIDPDNRGDIVSHCIFSDGCAASLITTQPSSKVVGKMAIVDDISFLMRDSTHVLNMFIGNNGIDLTLKPELSAAILKHINGVLTEFLGSNNMSVKDIEFWAVHPGGRKILEAVHNGLDLSPEDLSESYEVMRRYGNMVGCSAFFVLKRILEKHKILQEEGDNGYKSGIFMAFSPGASIEALLLKQVE
ncbi:hypothetical protein CYY_002060 [Polysphondylium violaceum]|uniref:Polyketide synthase n=1 Tax=Polysphondylium violaceum TaxID=133409 RepID=A0A8J4Q8C9_9MYCE|nr:hypothetical protein CYY_002060 [Polysphondylium violaceum]